MDKAGQEARAILHKRCKITHPNNQQPLYQMSPENNPGIPVMHAVSLERFLLKSQDLFNLEEGNLSMILFGFFKSHYDYNPAKVVNNVYNVPVSIKRLKKAFVSCFSPMIKCMERKLDTDVCCL